MSARNGDTPSIREIAELTARPRRLSAAGRDADPVERAAFLADKDALIERIETATRAAGARAPDTARQGETATTDAAHDGHRPAGVSSTTAADVDDAAGRFSGGYDAAHTAHLDALGQVDVHPTDLMDGRQLPLPMPAVMLDGIEQRRTGPAEWDDPAELDARLAALREQVAARVGEPAGGWRTVSAEQAARELAGRGAGVDTARAMVGDYLRNTSERIGAPAHEWGLDQGDIDAIATAHHLPTTMAGAEQDHPHACNVEPPTNPGSPAAPAVGRAHDALTALPEPAADNAAATGAGRGELAGWGRPDERAAAEVVVDDDGDGWSR